MIFRSCAGGVVFNKNKVLILKNDKGEWVLPKGKIRNGALSVETAIERIKEEAGVNAEIVSTAGETSYEFYSFSRQKPVCNEIVWYIMDTKDSEVKVNKDEGFIDGDFYDIDEALKLMTHNQEMALVNLSYKKYFKLYESNFALV